MMFFTEHFSLIAIMIVKIGSKIAGAPLNQNSIGEIIVTATKRYLLEICNVAQLAIIAMKYCIIEKVNSPTISE